MPWYPDKSEGYQLHENANDGGIRLLRGEPGGPWKLLTGNDKNEAIRRERKRVDQCNEVIGCYQGRTAIVFATGPMVGRITKEQIEYLREKNYLLVAINAAPGVALRYWNIDPSEAFDLVVAADALETWRFKRDAWGWDSLNGTPRFTRSQHYDRVHIPITGGSSPGLHLPKLYWTDSVTAAINLLCIMMSPPTQPKICAGPNMDWPHVQAQCNAGSGKIVLVGVEHNRYDHVYSGDERFAVWRPEKNDYVIPERPNDEWPNMEFKLKGHKIFGGFAREMGIKIYNAAPWSEIKEHEFVDFDEIFGIPEDIRTGVTSKGIPNG